MPQTAKHSIAKPQAEQIEASGYVITEDAEYALRDAARALGAIALLFEEHGADVPELVGGDYAAIFRTMGRQIDQIGRGAPFAIRAAARPPQCH